MKIIGYLADMTTGAQKYSKWKGLNIRIQNTTVVENEFFGYTDTPAQARITGEIQILNANEEELITMNRAGFVTSYPQYAEISNWLTEQLNDFGRGCVRRRTEFNASMKKKSNQLRVQSNVAESLERSITEVFPDENVDLSLLSKGKLKKEDEIDQEKALLESYPNEILEVIPVPENSSTEIKSDPVQGKFSVKVPENFLEYTINIGGEQYQIKYVDHNEEEPIIDVSTSEKTIRINNNAPPVKNGTRALVLALILFEYAFAAYPEDPKLLKEKTYEALMCAFQD